jgi:hypothetical protein
MYRRAVGVDKAGCELMVGLDSRHLHLPETLSAQITQHAGTRGGCRRGDRVFVCRGGPSGSLTFPWVSSTNQRSPGEWRQNRAASANSGVNRCTHRQTVTWSTSTPRSTQQFLHVSVGEVEPQVPAHRDDDHLDREPESSERRIRRQPRAKTNRRLHSPRVSRSCQRSTQRSPATYS